MNAVQAVYATFMGAVAGIIYEKKKNLVFPGLVHFANNFLAFLQGIVSPELGEIVNLFALVMIIPLGYILYRFLRRESVRIEPFGLRQ